MNLNLSAPTVPVFLIALVLAVLALIGHFVPLPVLTLYKFWIMTAAYIVLCLGAVLKGI